MTSVARVSVTFIALAAIGLATPVLAQSDRPNLQSPPPQNVVGNSNFDPARHRLTNYEKRPLLEERRQALHDLKMQIKSASSDEERKALQEKKHQLENEIIEIQQG